MVVQVAQFKKKHQVFTIIGHDSPSTAPFSSTSCEMWWRIYPQGVAVPFPEDLIEFSEDLQPEESIEVFDSNKRFGFGRTDIITNFGDGIVSVKPKRWKWTKKILGNILDEGTMIYIQPLSAI